MKGKTRWLRAALGTQQWEWGLALTRLAPVSSPPPQGSTTLPQFPYPGVGGRVVGPATQVSLLGVGGHHKMWPLGVSTCIGGHFRKGTATGRQCCNVQAEGDTPVLFGLEPRTARA